MGRRKKVYGTCRICGKDGQLSFEHVPPESAFNNEKAYYSASMDKLTKLDPDLLSKSASQLYNEKLAIKKQGGIGFNTLCVQCNNDTGSWYASDYVQWVYQSMGILMKAKGMPTLHYPTFFYPLRIIKQIITMFFSVCIEGFNENEPELANFILDKEKRGLSSRYKIYVYYNLKGAQRFIGNNFVGNLRTGQLIHMSEISFPPFGFVLTIDSESPDKRLTDITHFANSKYSEWTEQFQKFSVLPTHLAWYAGDYREWTEIEKAIKQDKNDC